MDSLSDTPEISPSKQEIAAAASTLATIRKLARRPSHAPKLILAALGAIGSIYAWTVSVDDRLAANMADHRVIQSQLEAQRTLLESVNSRAQEIDRQVTALSAAAASRR